MSHHVESLSLADDASVFNELPNINLRTPDPARINNSHLDDSDPSFLASTPYEYVVGLPHGSDYQPILRAPDWGYSVYANLIWYYGPWNMTFRYDSFSEEFSIITAYLRTLKLISLTHIRLGELCVIWTHKKMAQRGKIIEKFGEHIQATYYWVWILDYAEVELVHERNICLYPVKNTWFRVPPMAFSCYEYGIYPNRMVSSPGTLDWSWEVIPNKGGKYANILLHSNPYDTQHPPTRGLCQIRLVQAGYDGNDQHFRRMWPRTKDLIRFPVNIKPPDMYSFRDFLLGRARLLENNPDHIKVGVECLDKDCSRLGFCFHQPYHPAWPRISYLHVKREQYSDGTVPPPPGLTGFNRPECNAQGTFNSLFRFPLPSRAATGLFGAAFSSSGTGFDPYAFVASFSSTGGENLATGGSLTSGGRGERSENAACGGASVSTESGRSGFECPTIEVQNEDESS